MPGCILMVLISGHLNLNFDGLPIIVTRLHDYLSNDLMVLLNELMVSCVGVLFVLHNHHFVRVHLQLLKLL